jgi:zinc transport system substrate-binding protein
VRRIAPSPFSIFFEPPKDLKGARRVPTEAPAKDLDLLDFLGGRSLGGTHKISDLQIVLNGLQAEAMMSPLLSLLGLLSLSTPEPGQPIVVSVQSLKWIVQEVYPTSRIEVLCPPGSSPHSFEIKPEQLRLAAKAQFGLSISKDYDPWFDQVDLKKKAKLLTLLPEGARQQSHFEHHHHDHAGHDHHHHHGSEDPHFWMDPLTVDALLPNLSKQLCEWDPKNCDGIKNRIREFSKRLQILHQEVTSLMKDVQGRAFLSSHDGFGYFVRRYQLDYLEPIEPLPGKEPSPKDLKRLLDAVKKKNVKTIFGELQLPLAPVQSLAEAAKIRVEVLDQYGASAQIQSYADLLLDNAKKIRTGLEPIITP